jgi:hypothetical protein
VFAWSAKDLTGVDRKFIEHKLNIDPSVKPRKKKLRKMSDDKVVAVKSEVQRLLDSTVIREVMYPKWLANTVPVKKKNGKWRMCIDFTDLNKATPKDNYPLPRMDQVVDSAANAAIMSLLDCFSGYHQCWMAKEDEEKASFITPFGTFCFVRIPEGSKNVGSTFTRMTRIVFKPQIGRNVQAYVDDLIVKSSNRASHINDLAETFANMRRAALKLNSEKCVFGVTKGNILGCLISAKRIEANPDKIRAIREMEEPKTKKDIQKLNGRVAALKRFISRSAERSLPFFKALKGKGTIEWGLEQSKPSPSSRITSRKWQYYPHLRRRSHLSYTWPLQKLRSALLWSERSRPKKGSFNVPSILYPKPWRAPSCSILSWRKSLT